MGRVGNGGRVDLGEWRGRGRVEQRVEGESYSWVRMKCIKTIKIKIKGDV